MRLGRIGVIFVSLGIVAGCAPKRESSRVEVAVPKGVAAQRMLEKAINDQKQTGQSVEALGAIPPAYLNCFAVNISAPDMGAPAGGACQPALTAYTGFVGEGGTLSLEVPRGSGRRIELFLYLGDASGACPALDGDFISAGRFSRTYSVATLEGVAFSRDSEQVTMLVNFPGIQNSVSSQLGLGCGPSAGLKGLLYSNGDVRNVSGGVFSAAADPSLPYLSAFFKTTDGQSDVTGVGTLNRSGDLKIGASTVAIPKWVRSVTRKPDTEGLYGIAGQGQIVAIDASTGAVAELTALTCPFADTTCTVPPWFRSISAGRGSDLFGMDHSGQIYKVKSGGALELVTSVSPAVSQVSFY